MSDYEVNLVNDNMQELYVKFYGPAESTWRVHVYMSMYKLNMIVSRYTSTHHHQLVNILSSAVIGTLSPH